jgi:hypothetical protein
MEFPENAIIIDQVDGPGDGTDLEDCYFIWFSDSKTYSFFDKCGNEKGSGLTVDSIIIFSLDYVPHVMWALSIGPGSDATFVKGHWTDVPDAEPEGSYQAQVGGTPEVLKNAASATV